MAPAISLASSRTREMDMLGGSGVMCIEDLSKLHHWNVECRGIDDALALELHPHAIHAFARENYVKLRLRTAVGDERVGVNHVDQIVARGQHMPPGSQILLHPVERFELEE